MLLNAVNSTIHYSITKKKLTDISLFNPVQYNDYSFIYDPGPQVVIENFKGVITFNFIFITLYFSALI